MPLAPAVKQRLLRYCVRLNKNTGAEEEVKRLEYMQTVVSLPLGRYFTPFADCAAEEAMNGMCARMDAAVYGHAKAKRELMRVTAQWLRNPESKGLAILLCGPAGVGKTELVNRGVAAAMNMLGGMTCSSVLKGHSFCYTGSEPGSIVRALIRNGSMSQVFLFDELDKVSTTDQGTEIVNTLIHLTDETANTKFHDAYLGDIDLDMSRNLYFFTCNDASAVSPILLDRMIRIDVDRYSSADKFEIAKRHLMPAAIKAFDLGEHDSSALIASDSVIKHAVSLTSDEKGVRNLKRALRAVCAEVNLRRTLDPELTVTAEDLEHILRKETVGQTSHVHCMMYN